MKAPPPISLYFCTLDNSFNNHYMKHILKAACVAAILLTATTAPAQSLGGLVKSVTKKATEAASTGAIGGGLVDLIGLNKVSEESLHGTWSYEQPAVVLESKNVLNKLGGSLATATIESEMKKQLEKYGFTKGKVVLTFKADKSFTASLNGKTVSGTYTVNNTNLTLSRKGIASVVMNVKHSGSGLQVAVPADKVLSLVNAVGSAAAKADSRIGAVTDLLKQYKGMYLGLKFTAQQ